MFGNREKPKYGRIMLKMSGEILMGNSQFGIDPVVLDRIASEVTEIASLGIEVGLVMGGGNLFRGEALAKVGLGRVTGDHMGMLATTMNALALRDAMERAGVETRVMSAITMTGLVDPMDIRKADYHLRHGIVVIFSGGTGNPFFTTDSAASLRGIEIGADVLLKGTKVDGVYTDDPTLVPAAKRYSQLNYREVIEKDLRVMDTTAICMCRDHQLPIIVFNINKPHALKDIMLGLDEGTLIHATQSTLANS
ncbi:MAG: uridylate kinase [Gammaproteobacteria bacterium]|jgi:uridylate kinase|nr:uridylate kinase [Gammaproteobacteria bacterium]